MFPTTRANTTVVTSILSTLDRGSGTSQDSGGVTGSTSTLPFYPDMPADLVNRVITSNLTGSNTISTAGLAAESVAFLANIRTRVDEAVASIYAETPNISPYYYGNGTIKSSTLREGRRDRIIQALFNYDARYYLRKRAGPGQGGDNANYEFPTRHNYMNTPYIEAILRDHTISGGTVDDNGVGGAYRIVTTDPHGIYDITEGGLGVMSFWRAGNSGTSVLNKAYYVDDLYQERSITLDGTDTNSKFRFNANIGTNWLVDGNVSVTSNIGYAVGSRIMTNDAPTTWIPPSWQPPERYFKLVDSGTAYEYYHDYNLTEKMIPGYGYIRSIQAGNNNTVDVPAGGLTGGISVRTSNQFGNVNYSHMIYEDLPQFFERPAGWTGNVSVLDRFTVTSYVNRPVAGSYWTTTGNASIYNSQFVNLVTPGTGFTALNNDDTPLYFKRETGNALTLWEDSSLSTLYYLGRMIGGISNIAYSGGNVRVTYNEDFPRVAEGIGIRIRSSGTAFSDSYNVNSVFANNVCQLDSVHIFEQGQPVWNFQNGDQTYFAEVTGFANTQVRLHTGVSWSGGVPTFSGNTAPAVNDDLQPAWFLKRISNTVYELYNDQGLTSAYTTVNSLASVTYPADSRTIPYTLTLNSGSYVQPGFFCRMDSYTSASLWVDAARTIPYNFYYANGATGGSGTISTVQGTAAAEYRINGQGHALGFTSNAKSMGWTVSQVVWPKVINDTTVDLYADPGRNAPIKAPAISSPQTTNGLTATYLFDGRWRLDYFDPRNVGGSTYFYDADGDGISESVGAGWNTTGEYFYTPHYAGQEMNYVTPTIIVETYTAANAGAYYGHLRNITGNASLVSATGPVYKDPATFGGVSNTYADGCPIAYAKNDPGMFKYSTPFVIGIERFDDTVITVTGADDLALANTAPEWDTVNNMLDRATRIWPNDSNPSSVTWTIEQPNQVLETLNSTRFTRAADVTQYRIRYIYPPMTREQFKPYLDVIHAARGSFKPFKLYVPVATGASEQTGDNSLTIRYWDRASSANVPITVRARETMNGGTKVLKLDGAPINFNKTVGNATIGTSYVYGKGHALGSRHEYLQDEPGFVSSLGAWMLPIHEVESNSYGEMNIRLNNGIPGEYELGTRIFSDAAPLNVFLDGNNIELKVDVLGYHYLEVEFITKKIF